MSMDEHLSELTLLKEIAETLNKGTDIQLVLDDVLSKLLEVTGFETGWLFLLDENEEATITASRNLPPALVNETMCGNDCWCVERYENGKLLQATNIIACKRLENAIAGNWDETFGLTSCDCPFTVRK
jgi:two-component system, NarL family, sensor kinase